MTRTYWLSFADAGGFKGVAVVDVTDADVAEARAILEAGPHAAVYDREAGPPILAAARKAWREGCNPGGQIASYDVTAEPGASAFPRNRLLARDEAEALFERRVN